MGPEMTAEPAAPPSYAQAARPSQVQGYWAPDTSYYAQQSDGITPGANSPVTASYENGCMEDFGTLLTF